MLGEMFWNDPELNGRRVVLQADSAAAPTELAARQRGRERQGQLRPGAR